MFNRGRIADAQRALAAGGRVVDVRTPGEFQAGHLPGAVNAPLDTLPGSVERLTKGGRETPLLLYCRSGARSARAAGLLRRAGYRDVTDLGGLGSAQVVLSGTAAAE
ncbi:MAG: rhodanese-like domain-containing protein [Planctomycetes bacterium]|nr:rhodanese-like domain-containing protein [Planctomycetota bacterium]